MSNLGFAWPYAALLLLLLLPMWLVDNKYFQESSYLRSSIALAMARLAQNRSGNPRPSRLNWWLFLFWALLVVGLMRPQLVGLPIEIFRDGRNIMMVLDISESMETKDMKLRNNPQERLTVAKSVMRDFIDKRRGDRVGLVVFGSESFLHAPLSFDHKTIKRFLSEAEIGFAGPKTAIGDAIGLSVKKLLEETTGDRVMVLLTDGQNNMGALEPMQAGKIAQKQGIKIYIVGLGSSRVVVDGFFGPTAINPSVSLEEAEPELTEIAQLTGGKYFRARDHDALSRIYQEIDKLEPVRSEPLVILPRKELFYWPLALSLIILLLRSLFIEGKYLWSRRINREHLMEVER